jgi:hypothetical protein
MEMKGHQSRRHGHTEEASGYRNGNHPRCLTIQVVAILQTRARDDRWVFRFRTAQGSIP